MPCKIEAIFLLIGAFVLDAVIGDPNYPLHPTRLIGKLIEICEKFIRGVGLNGFTGGFLISLIVILISFLSIFGAAYLLNNIHPLLSLVFCMFILYSSIAFKDMIEHVERAEKALKKEDQESAKKAIAMIVGRKTDNLSETEIIKAAIESLSENLTDGLVAVLFYYAIGFFFGKFLSLYPIATATTFAFVYRTVNTMDSMMGYKNKKYLHFGYFCAKLDDILNFIPARIGLFLTCAGAVFIKENPVRCLKVARRDRLKHPSPNAAHTESAFAGALGVKLGESTEYPFGIVEKPPLGGEFAPPNTNAIKRALRLFKASGLLAVALTSLAILI